MKRNCAESPDIFASWAHFPDELLCALMLQAYDWRLRTLFECRALHRLRCVSRRFARVIDDCVVPQVRGLGDTVVEAMGETVVYTDAEGDTCQQRDPNARLLRYVHLESLHIDTPRLFGQAGALAALHALKWVTRVDLSQNGPGTPWEVEAVEAMSHVKELTLSKMVWDRGRELNMALQALTGLRSLQLDRVPSIDDASLRNMSALQTLVLRNATGIKNLAPLLSLHTLVVSVIDEVPNFASLARPGQLRRLCVDACNRGHGHINMDRALRHFNQLDALVLTASRDITDDTLGQLTTLRSLLLVGNQESVSPDSLSRLTNLRSLALHANMVVLLNRLHAAAMPRLSWLCLCNTGVCASALEGFAALTYLDLCGCDFSASHEAVDRALGAMRQLKTLDLSRTTGPRGEKLPLTLRTLMLEHNHYIGDAALARLTGLTTLSLAYNSRILDPGLAPLLRLTRLDLTANSGVTERSVAGLPALQYLAVNRSLICQESDGYRMLCPFKARRCVVSCVSIEWPLGRRAMPEWYDVPTAPLDAFELKLRDKVHGKKFEDFITPSVE